MKLFFIILGLLTFCFEVQAQDYACEKLKSDEKTRQGANEIVVFKERKTFPLIRGTVFGWNNQPVESVFVEVFADKNPNRLIGCKTGSDGKFSFADFKNGNFTIRLSKDGGYKITEIRIKVSSKSKNRKDIIGIIEVGT